MARRLRKAWMFGLLAGVVAWAGCTTPPVGPRVCSTSRTEALQHSLGNMPPPKKDMFLPHLHEGPELPPGSSLPQQPPGTVRSQSPALPPSLPPANKPGPAASLMPPSSPQAPDLAPLRVRICAWVNSKPIFEGELFFLAGGELHEASKYTEPERSEKRKVALNKRMKELIEQEVVLQDAYKKLEKSPQFLDKLKDMARKNFNNFVFKDRQKKGLSEFEYKKVLEMQGTTFESLQRLVERQFVVTQYMQSRVAPITDKVGLQEIREYYDTHQNEFQTVDRVEWEDIFILVGGQRAPTMDHARQWAQYIAYRLSMGDSITALLEFDDGDSSTRKGRGYGERRGEIKPAELEPHLFNMKAGQVSQPVEMATGIHVFRVINREYAAQMPFTAEVQTKIRTKLKNDIAQKEFDRIVRQLASKTVIEIDPNVFK